MDDYVAMRRLQNLEVNFKGDDTITMTTTVEKRCKGAGVMDQIKNLAWKCISGAAVGVVTLGFTQVGANVIWVNVLQKSKFLTVAPGGWLLNAVSGCLANTL